MRNVVLGMRWLALPTAAFVIFAIATGVAYQAALVAMVVVGVAVIVVSAADLMVRRR